MRYYWDNNELINERYVYGDNRYRTPNKKLSTHDSYIKDYHVGI